MSDHTTTYLLPCGCGRENPIELRQAGESLQCSCGRTCTVPTMREIRSLSPALAPMAASTATKPAWENPQRLLVTGLAVFFLAAVAAAILYGQFPAHFHGFRSPEAERALVKGMPLMETLRYYSQRILPGLEMRQPAAVESERSKVYLGLATVACLGVIGALLAGIGIAGIVRRRYSRSCS